MKGHLTGDDEEDEDHDCGNDEGGSEEHGTDNDDRGCRGCDDAGGNDFSHDKFLKRYEEGEEDEASGEVEQGKRRRRGCN